MKHLTPIIAELDSLESTPPTGNNVNWQAEYNKLRSKLLKLKQRIKTLESPPRNDVELESNLVAIRVFANSMGSAEGAVTCANLYNKAFFEKEKDSRFVRILCQFLVERYKSDSSLIETQYANWTRLAN
jgi:hypothetical protein